MTVGVDPTLNFDFNARPPSNIPSAANFSARWTGKIRPRFTERYLLSTFSDDGVRVLINGQAVIDNYTYHPPTWNSGSIDLLGNQDYDIEVDYFQGMWDAKLQLWWQSASQGNEIVPQTQLYAAASPSSQGVANGQGLTAEYFAVDASGAHLQGSPTTTEMAATINFDFNARPPGSVPSATNFSARFTGKIRPRYSGTYVFSTFSDDGVRVKIGGQTVIDNFTYHAPTWDSNSIALQAGQDYDVEVDYFQGIGDAYLQLWWASPSQPREIVPQSQLYPAQVASGVQSYYVSPTGNDSNSGLSADRAWASIQRVSRQTYNPGDTILFQRGGRYAGSLRPQGSGTSAAPISIGAYGSGALPILDGGGQEEALRLFNQQHWNVDSIEIVGGKQFVVLF